MAGDPTASSAPPEYTAIGRLGRAFQLEGGLHFRSLGPAEESVLESVEAVFVIGLGRVRLREVRWLGGAPVVYLTGVRDRDAARALTNAEVFAATAAVHAARRADPESRLEHELIGAEVLLEGVRIGVVAEVQLGGNNELLVVETARGAVLLPLTAPYVQRSEGRVLLVDPPAGLL